MPALCLSDPKVETESCGRMKVAGNMTSSGKRSRHQRAARSSLPSMDMISGTVAPKGTDHTGSVGPGECFFVAYVRFKFLC